MPRRELLTPEQRLQLFAFHDDRSELIRLAILSKPDVSPARLLLVCPTVQGRSQRGLRGYAGCGRSRDP
jgi:hypothetical protein